MEQEMERRILPIQEMEIRKIEDKSIIGGYAAKFEQLSEPLWGFREKIRPGAFAKSLSERNVIAFWNHNTDMVLGNTESNTAKVWEDEIGLRFEVELPDTTAGRDAMTLVQRGDVKGVSFGFRTRVDEWDESDKNNVIRTLVDVMLYEVSPTAMPAYPQTNVAARSIQDIYEEHKKDVEESRKRQCETRDRAAKIRQNQIIIAGLEVKQL